MNLVDSSVWILIVSMLATVEVTKPVNEHGEIVEPEVKFENPIFRWAFCFVLFLLFWADSVRCMTLGCFSRMTTIDEDFRLDLLMVFTVSTAF